jgi:hypothetical protein
MGGGVRYWELLLTQLWKILPFLGMWIIWNKVQGRSFASLRMTEGGTQDDKTPITLSERSE